MDPSRRPRGAAPARAASLPAMLPAAMVAAIRAAMVVGLAGLGVAGAARAEQLVLGLEQAVTGQSNLFRSRFGSIADGNYELSPYLLVLGEHGELDYSLEYRPSYEWYFVSDDVDGLDHFFRGTLVWDVLPVSRLRMRADVADYRSVRAVTAEGPGGIPDIIPRATGRINRAFVNVEYEHEVTRATVATGRLGFQSYAYTTPSNADSLGFAAEGSVVHRLRREIGLGGSLLGSHRRFDELGLSPGSDNTVVNANLVALYEPTPSWFFEVSAGPAVIFTRQDELGPQLVDRYFGFQGDDPGETFVREFDPAGCTPIRGQPVLAGCAPALYPGFPGSVADRVLVTFDPGTQTTSADQDLVTAFVTAEIRREDSWGTVSLVYFRGEDASAGIGTTTVRDSVTASIVAEPIRDVEVRLRGNWNRRDATGATNRFAVRAGASPIDFPGGEPVAQANGLIDTGLRTQTKITQYWADLLVTRELVERLWVEVGFRYLSQERIEQPSIDPALATFRFENYVGSLMLRYELESIEVF